MNSSFERYSKQVLFRGMGEERQRLLSEKKVLLCGCGALGTVIADQLTRAGVGHLVVVDRDFVELSNLQRQVLYDERDVEERLPKAVAAAEKLSRINSSITIGPIVADIDAGNIESLAQDCDLILDGTDNFEVRFLINDVSLELGIPWIYTGCIGSHGQVMPIFPGETACLRCLMNDVPEPGSTETCDTAGVLGPAVNIIASYETVLALKILSEQKELVPPVMTVIDVWEGSWREMKLGSLRDQSDCPACMHGKRDWLRGGRGSQSTVLCGRNAVQVIPEQKRSLSLDDLHSKLSTSGSVTQNPYLLKFSPTESDHEFTIFKDGRAIIQGTDDLAEARSLYSRYIGG
ncbi:MAG: ThiF family adenylyltransferase [Planctomycetaceae bacterium]|nr:ThiF family adenylyltransferase [Planctomycetaceae bacterium]